MRSMRAHHEHAKHASPRPASVSWLAYVQACVADLDATNIRGPRQQAESRRPRRNHAPVPVHKGEAESLAVTSTTRPARPIGRAGQRYPSNPTYEPPKAASLGARAVGARRHQSIEGEAESRAVT